MAPRKKSSKADSGSPSPGEPEYLVVGYLRRTHGVGGEMVMEVHTDFPERLRPDVGVFVGDDFQPLTISGTRPHNEGMLIKFQGLIRLRRPAVSAIGLCTLRHQIVLRCPRASIITIS